MLTTRVIPCLLLRDQGLVKTVRFRDAKYVGDPINAVKIFNEKEVDELVLLDLWAKLDGEDAVYADITWVGYTGAQVPDRFVQTFEAVRAAGAPESSPRPHG